MSEKTAVWSTAATKTMTPTLSASTIIAASPLFAVSGFSTSTSTESSEEKSTNGSTSMRL